MTIKCDNCLNAINLHSSNTDLFTNKKFDIYFCKKCSIAKTNLPKEFDIREHYPQNYYGQEGKKFNFIVELIVLCSRFFRSIFCYQIFNKKNIKLLDIGCGRGHFLSFLKKKGWLVYGTESSEISGSKAKKKVGDQSILISQNFEDLKKIDTTFDIITLWHVLEHIENPKKIVALIDKKLVNNGYLVIEVPNFNSIQHLINKNDWIHLDCPRHVIHFSKEGLVKFFDVEKFKIIKSSTFSLEFGFYGMLQSLLNLFVPAPNYLFSLIRKKNAKLKKISLIKNYLSMFLTIILLIPLSFISIILESIAIIFKSGGILRVVIKKI